MSKKIDIKEITSKEQLQELNLSFEEVYAMLEKIVDLQEKGDVILEDSIKFYKIGKILAEYAQDILQKAKLEIEKVN
ncbi:MAG: exodeoxyribonuclease VII small subunit [Alphaproteobacteria bacterium]|jgi:exodeoxyribonuclease VII small subunit|nr:exodeoxyribonuclease VII small subunit [Alphaproteobacteria bacterium]